MAAQTEQIVVEHFQATHVSLKEDSIFMLCSILSRQTRIATSKLNSSSLEYFKSVLDECQSRDKKYRKRIKKSAANSELNFSNAYVDFLKSTMLYSESIKKVLNDVDSDELFESALKSALTLYLARNESVRLEFNPCLVTSKNDEEEQDPAAYLVRSITYALNNASIEHFKRALELLEQSMDKEMTQLGDPEPNFDVFVRLANLFKTLSSDFELKHEFKDDYSKFLQKV